VFSIEEEEINKRSSMAWNPNKSPSNDAHTTALRGGITSVPGQEVNQGKPYLKGMASLYGGRTWKKRGERPTISLVLVMIFFFYFPLLSFLPTLMWRMIMVLSTIYKETCLHVPLTTTFTKEHTQCSSNSQTIIALNFYPFVYISVPPTQCICPPLFWRAFSLVLKVTREKRKTNLSSSLFLSICDGKCLGS